MDDYPRNINELETRFSTEEACRVYLFRLRWPEGFRCPREHLDCYLDEFTFRFNRRNSKSRGKLFYRLVQQAVAVAPVPYKAMVKCYAIGAEADHNL
jgi:hypothetical protein